MIPIAAILGNPVVMQGALSLIDTAISIVTRHAGGDLTDEQALEELRKAGVNVDDAAASWEASKASHQSPPA